MDALEDALRNVVMRLDAAVKAVGKVKKYKDIVKPHAPATEEQIEGYEAFLGLRLPNSYRTFLSLYNGYDWLVLLGHMLPIEAVMPGRREFDYIQRWKLDSAKYGNGEVLDAIVIADLGEPGNYVYLEPKKRISADDFVVVQSDPESSTEYQGLVHFFEATIESCEYIIRDTLNPNQSIN